MALFMSGYVCALIYSGINLSELFFREEHYFLVFALWILWGSSLPLGLFRKKCVSWLKRVGGVALTFVIHLSVAFLFLNAWTLLSPRGPFPAPTDREAGIVLNLALLWIACGVAWAQRIGVRSFEVELPSSVLHSPVRIVAAADIHAGGIVERRYLRRLQKRIALCRPDIVLLPGDVTDGDVPRAADAGLTETLAALEAPLGKYAVLGNHDIYAGAEASRSLLNEAGFIVLEDEARVIDGALVLVGRNDPRGVHFDIPRAPLASLLEGQSELPVVVVDHTPCNLKEAEDCGVDLQISGHTHGGQVFPFNLVMKWKYGISSGLTRRGKTTVCVSPGAGLWTMPLRTVTSSEIVLCTLVFVPKARQPDSCPD
ncbi:MAG: metallophosphoesterase [Synergistaceae bacterium]|jgi:predicted MPP superfamily phosphohydrolase|nr:metallophosphoesterase [Synergistaceae bacterium]